MKSTPAILFGLGLLGALGLAALSGCSRSAPEAAPAFKKGSRPFAFDYERVPELLLARHDPATGEAWTARLVRPDPATPDWKVLSEGNAAGGPIVDRAADGFMILHLLDTLRTLEIVENAPPTPSDTAGLAPPRFALRWSEGGRPFELRVGATDPKTGATYAQFGPAAPGAPTAMVRGATLAMLGYIRGFDSIRLKTWAGIQADDVDEIRFRRGGREVFYAQREGAQWTRRDHRPWPASQIDVGSRLEAIAHLRIKAYVDAEAEAARLARRIAGPGAPPGIDVILTARSGREIRLRASLINEKLFATNSARDGAVFEIHRDSLRFFSNPGK